MPSYRKETRVGDLLTFSVETDNSRTETQTYKLAEGETEVALMERVVKHQNDEWAKKLPKEQMVSKRVNSTLIQAQSTFTEVEKVVKPK